MALDKGDISGTTDRYVNLLGKVKTACNDAAGKVRDCQSDVSSNWKGESGEAMADALTALEKEIKAILSRCRVANSRFAARLAVKKIPSVRISAVIAAPI